MEQKSATEDPKKPRPSFKVVATLVKAANRFKNSFNVEYTPGKKKDGDSVGPAVNHRGAKAALILGTVEKNQHKPQLGASASLKQMRVQSTTAQTAGGTRQ